MEKFDLNMLATIKEDPAITEGRRRRFAELFGEPLPATIVLPGGDTGQVIRLDARRRARPSPTA